MSSLTSIVIVTYNGLSTLQPCIDSILRHTSPESYEIIVVDNGSTDGTLEWLDLQPHLLTIRNAENLGFPKGCNQGLSIARGENLLLLNNDTIVTPRWLEQLTSALQSDASIGAVGPVTNNASYYSSMPVSYASLDELIAFSEQYNRSDPAKWEERLKLIGFCLLFKREAYVKIGGLDERFSPGNYEDDDFCLRLRLAGYRTLICTDTFIHHEGSLSFQRDPESYHSLLQRNEMKFTEKWGFSPVYSLGIRLDILQLIARHDRLQPVKVLEIGCACGGTLLELRNWYPHAELYGLELNDKAAAVAATIARVRTGNIETMSLELPLDSFDYIIFADVLEHLHEPWDVLRRMLPYLKDSGKVIASIPNISHYSIIRDLMNGEWQYANRGLLDITHFRFFTLSGIQRMFSSAGYQALQLHQNVLPPGEEDMRWIDRMASAAGSDKKSEWLAYQYLCVAYKSYPADPVHETDLELKQILRRLDWNIETDASGIALAALYADRGMNEELLADAIVRETMDAEGTAEKIIPSLTASGIHIDEEMLLGLISQRKSLET